MNQKVTRLIIFTAAIMLLAQSAFALEHKRKGEYQKEATSLNRWSFMLAVDQNLEDEDYHGLRFSLKHQNDEHSAVRFNLGIVGRDLHNNGIYIHPGGYFVDMDDSPDFDVTGANVSVQYLFYPAPQRKLNLYFGIGPRFSADEAEQDVMVTYYYDYPYDYVDYYADDLTRLALGVETTVGFEWFLGRNFSLLTELDFVIQNEWYAFDVDYYDNFGRVKTEVETFDDGVHFDASRLKLGLAFHF